MSEKFSWTERYLAGGYGLEITQITELKYWYFLNYQIIGTDTHSKLNLLINSTSDAVGSKV